MRYPDAATTALFLDFDGTLVDIVETPDAVTVPSSLPDLLEQVQARLDGAVAVVSGRPIAEIDRFLAPATLPAAGLHGLEWRRSQEIERMRQPASIEDIRRRIAETGLADRGLRIEDKGLSLALHFREMPALADEVADAAEEAAAHHSDLSVLHGKMVVEIKPRAASKASAVRRFMAEEPFVGRRPVFVGDDVTDEDGMKAALAAGGSAIKVGDGESVATERLDGPADVHRWLADLLAASG